ncbi:hypothetical protein C8Q69DRAFT_472571 [Paecilomyces variotii]|uniref:Amidohydrolase-related domain-containing protein n=1 Tax=Byssochlamys spectabilis TaxID=264951 RepID=A0A443HQJ8_BYSSP|nr:hypothetical protein C8Q69DRAFT_472571 [Paecilomyces variotii]KAJ9358177.1 hypothetical protein DTO280E4_5286 [Paecilomyces variotii]RWQ94081.1 hypothetical protein C8Q69DRAFT_472571 [Paecilomyces variotii]
MPTVANWMDISYREFDDENFSMQTRTTPEKLLKPWLPQPQKTYIFRNANIINPVDGSVRSNSTVKISGGFVESITDTIAEEAEIADSGVTVLDLGSKYLCPGLIDCHVHLTAVPGGKDLGGAFGIAEDVSKFRQPFVCQQMLRRGFTTVRDCGGASLALKEAIAEGVFQGPRLFIAGHALTQTGGHADLRASHDHTECCGGTVTGLGRLCDGVPECIKYAREELRSGADFIKIMTGGGVASPTDALTNLQFTAEEIQAITTVADTYDTWVTAHAYTPRSIMHAINNGVKGIEHGNMIDTETAKIMAEKGVFLTPTLIAYSEMSSPRWPGFLPPESVVKNEAVLRAGLRSLQIASEAGVTLCYGTDLLGPLGIAQTKEFAIRSQVLSPLAILQSATVNAAKMLRKPDFLGQIQPGFAADLLILTQNPLEDVTIFDEPDKNLLAVIKDGRVETSRWSQLSEEVSNPVSVIE